MKATVYRILHIATGRCYVGHTTKRVAARFAEHRYLLRAGKHHSKFLQNAWVKYGEYAFVFETLEECDEEHKLVREQHFMDQLESCFNTAPVAGSRKGCPQPPHEVERLRKQMKGNQYTKGRVVPEDEKERRAAAGRGKKRSPETRARMSAGMKGVPHIKARGRVVSEETRAKIREATDATRPTMAGKRHSPETIEKIRQANIATKARKRAEAQAGAG